MTTTDRRCSRQAAAELFLDFARQARSTSPPDPEPFPLLPLTEAFATLDMRFAFETAGRGDDIITLHTLSQGD